MATALTPTELSHSDIPSCLDSGTASRRILVHVRYTSTAVDDTVTLTTYIPEIKDIECVVGSTLDGADVGPTMTAHTWSAGVITTAGHSGSGVWEQTLICTIT